jgi:hypothetical protein
VLVIALVIGLARFRRAQPGWTAAAPAAVTAS